MKTNLFIAASLLFAASVTNAFGGVDFFGKSAINVNGNWYYAGENLNWDGDNIFGFFNGSNLGYLTALELGGHSETYEKINNEGAGKDWKSGQVEMHYRIRNGEDSKLEGTIILPYKNFVNNNNIFEKGHWDGSNFIFESVDINISSLTDGTMYYLDIWFKLDNDHWDSNNSANYVATFTKGPLVLNSKANNSNILNASRDKHADVLIIEDLTLFKDNHWNTLCLPFSLSSTEIGSSPLADANIQELTSSSFTDGTLNLTFTQKMMALLLVFHIS